MATDILYTPVLKAKQSECIALRRVNPKLKPLMIPLFEMQPRDTPHLLMRTVTQMEKSWEKHLPLFLDVDKKYLASNEAEAVENHATALERGRKSGYNIIPVTGLRRSERYQGNISSAVQQDRRGVCLRLENEDWLDVSELNTKIDKILSNLGVIAGEMDLILDFGAFLPSQAGTIVTSATTTINNLKLVSELRNLVVTGTAFPASLNVAPTSVKTIPRSEWIVWLELRKIYKKNLIKRMPIFGDYIIVHPVFPEIDFRYVDISPKIKYTTESDWIYIRWKPSIKGDYSGFHDVCNLLLAQTQYSGSDFCWGDNRISQCSKSPVDTGNPGQWTTIGINHHLTFVTEQLASFYGL